MEKQRMFSLKFSTTSLSPENEPAAIEMKVMRILDDVAKCISEGQLQGAVRDGNANVIGQFILHRERAPRSDGQCRRLGGEKRAARTRFHT
jgi:hypothetical protein